MAKNDSEKPYQWILVDYSTRPAKWVSGPYKSIAHAQRDRDAHRRAGRPLTITPLPNRKAT